MNCDCLNYIGWCNHISLSNHVESNQPSFMSCINLYIRSVMSETPKWWTNHQPTGLELAAKHRACNKREIATSSPRGQKVAGEYDHSPVELGYLQWFYGYLAPVHNTWWLFFGMNDGLCFLARFFFPLRKMAKFWDQNKTTAAQLLEGWPRGDGDPGHIGTLRVCADPVLPVRNS